MILVENLTKAYDDKVAINNLSFEIKKGEIVGFLGPNGAGKSTTMKVLTCFMPATEGNAFIAGYDIFTQSIYVRRNIGYLPENPPLYLDLRVKEFLKYRASLKNVEKSKINSEIADVIEKCRIGDYANSIIGTLSKGYRQRVGLADALLNNPPILILDEPTVGLDVKEIRPIRDLIKSLGKDHTILLSTHILPEVEMVCERVIILNQGQIVADSNIKDLAGKKNEYHIELKANDKIDTFEAKLKHLEGFIKLDKKVIDEKDFTNKYIIYFEQIKDDHREKIFNIINEENLTLLELYRPTLSLEEIFINKTMKKID
jgi:ABC-2 type transport system ATP-binding protein